MSFGSWLKKAFDKVADTLYASVVTVFAGPVALFGNKKAQKIVDSAWDAVIEGKSGQEKKTESVKDAIYAKYLEIKKRHGLRIPDSVLEKSAQGIAANKTREEYSFGNFQFGVVFGASFGKGGLRFEPAPSLSFGFAPNPERSYVQIEEWNAKAFFLKYQREELQHRQREFLTEILMKNPFEIFANGQYYAQGAPGSPSYAPLNVWTPYRYVTGEVEFDEFNDVLTGKSHLKLAGNRDFLIRLWDEPQWAFVERSTYQRHMRAGYEAIARNVLEGYAALADVGFVEVDKFGLEDHMQRDLFGETIVKGPLTLDGEKYPQYRDLSKTGTGIRYSRYSRL